MKTILYSMLWWGIFSQIYGSITPELQQSLNINAKDLGVFVSVMSIGGALGAIVGGTDLVFLGRKRVFILTICTVTALLIAGFANSIITFATGLILYTINCTALITTFHSIVARIPVEFSDQKVKKFAALDAAFSLGAVISPIWTSFLLQMFDGNWRVPILFVCAAAAPIPVIALFSMKATEDEKFQERERRRIDTFVVKTPFTSYLKYLALAACLGYIEWGISFWFVAYAVDSPAQISPVLARFSLSSFMIGIVLIRILRASSLRKIDAFLDRNISKFLTAGLIALIIQILLTSANTKLPIHILVPLSTLVLGVSIGMIFPVVLSAFVTETRISGARCSSLLLLAIMGGSQIAGAVISIGSIYWGLTTSYYSMIAAMIGLLTFSYVVRSNSIGMRI